MNLKKEEYDWINKRYAEQVLKSVKDYKVSLKMENAVQLVCYEDSLNNILNADVIEVNESGNILRTLTSDEQKLIVNTAKMEMENIGLIKTYLKIK